MVVVSVEDSLIILTLALCYGTRDLYSELELFNWRNRFMLDQRAIAVEWEKPYQEQCCDHFRFYWIEKFDDNFMSRKFHFIDGIFPSFVASFFYPLFNFFHKLYS